MRQLTFNDPVVELDPVFKLCPSCHTKIPVFLVICWNCGDCLDPRINNIQSARDSQKMTKKKSPPKRARTAPSGQTFPHGAIRVNGIKEVEK